MEAVVLILHERDNVAVVLKDIAEGQVITLANGNQISARTFIPYSHKVAITDLADGFTIYKYGEIIGYAQGDISCGDWVHTHNIKD